MALSERPALMRFTAKKPLKGWALVADLMSGRVKFAGTLEECYDYTRRHGDNLKIMALTNIQYLSQGIASVKAAMDEAEALSRTSKKDEEPKEE